MSIAIAGSGDLARYLTEELRRSNFSVILLCRSKKPHFDLPGVTQKEVDFTSVPSLTAALEDALALVSCILDYTMTFTEVHKNLIEACQQILNCKRFIPAEYGGDVDAYPDQPGFYYPNHEPIRQILRKQTALEWTILCCSWLVDYVVPARNRYLKDVGDAFPVNLAERKMVIPGSGKEAIDVIGARDLAKAIVALLRAPAGSWDAFIYVSGEKTSWKRVAEQVRAKYGGEFETRYNSLNDLVGTVRDAEDDMQRIVAEYGIFSVSGAGDLDVGKVEEHRRKYFEGINFRTVQEILDEIDGNEDVIV